VKAAELLAADRQAEAEPVPVENRAEHGIEVGEIQIIDGARDTDTRRSRSMSQT
jgi:hypothetical protein